MLSCFSLIILSHTFSSVLNALASLKELLFIHFLLTRTIINILLFYNNDFKMLSYFILLHNFISCQMFLASLKENLFFLDFILLSMVLFISLLYFAKHGFYLFLNWWKSSNPYNIYVKHKMHLNSYWY